MGFLDLLSGKKKKEGGSNIPPPAPGAAQTQDGKGAQGSSMPPPADPNKDDGKDKGASSIPKPPQGNPGDQSKGQDAEEGKAPGKDSQGKPSAPGGLGGTGSDAQGGQAPPNPAPAFKDDFPKLDLPKFPGSNKDKPKVPVFPGKAQDGQNASESSQENNAAQGPMNQDQQKAQQTQGTPPPTPAFGAKEDKGQQASDIGSGAGPVPSPKLQQQGGDKPSNQQEQGMGMGGQEASQFQQPPQQANQQQQPQAQQDNNDPNTSFNKWHPSKFESEGEQELSRMKHDLHKPADEVGTDRFTIGNIEKGMKKTRKFTGPLYVEINDYKRVLNSVDEMKRDINESHDYAIKLDEFNSSKHQEFEKWKKAFEYIHSKLQFVDKTLFEEINK